MLDNFYLHQLFVIVFLFTSIGVCNAGSDVEVESSSQDAIRPMVVIVSLKNCCKDEAWPEAEEKIRLEFVQGGIEVVVVDGQALTEAERRKELIDIASEYEAAAAIRILKPPTTSNKAGVDLWITDRVTQKTVYRFLPLVDVQSGESSLVAALKTIELFKGSLQEIHLEKEKRKLPKPIANLTESPAYPPAATKKFLFGGGFGGIFFARDVGFRGAPMVWLGWQPAPSFLLQLEGVFGVIGRDVVSNGSASNLFFNAVMFRTMWVMNQSSIVQPAVGAVMGAAFIQAEGVRSNLMEQKEAHLTSLMLGVGTQLSFALTDALWLTSAFDIGFITPQARIVFNGEEIARFGMPILKLSLLLNVHF